MRPCCGSLPFIVSTHYDSTPPFYFFPLGPVSHFFILNLCRSAFPILTTTLFILHIFIKLLHHSVICSNLLGHVWICLIINEILPFFYHPLILFFKNILITSHFGTK